MVVKSKGRHLGLKLMKEEELANMLSQSLSVSIELAEQMINTFADILMETVSSGEKVKIDKLGLLNDVQEKKDKVEILKVEKS
jgi:nucleoid DNA-binding protein